MKKLNIAILLAIASLVSVAQPADYSAYWPFNGDASDATGNGHNGVVSGATLTDDRFGNPNSAYAFDGIDDFISMTLGSNSAPFTISTWCYFNEVNPTSYDYVLILGNGGSSNPTSTSISRWANSGDFYSYSFGVSRKGPFLQGQQWLHITTVLDDQSPYLKLYINGVQVSVDAIPGAVSTNGALTLGKFPAGETHHFDGKIDDLMYFDRALTDIEVQELYSQQENSATIGWQTETSKVYVIDQSVGIGTSSIPDDYELAVEGKIISEEVKVELSNNWPDYVFESNYKLLTLEEVEDYIKEKGHLPEIPGQSEVTENGINLGEMNAKLLQKIEELTLYLIEQNKKIKQLEEEIAHLKNE